MQEEQKFPLGFFPLANPSAAAEELLQEEVLSMGAKVLSIIWVLNYNQIRHALSASSWTKDWFPQQTPCVRGKPSALKLD